MSIFKRGNLYWFHFLFNGEHIQRSTKQGNPRIARQMEAAHRTALAKGEVGIVERQPAPTLGKFIEACFEPWARATLEKASPKTWTGWYRTQLGNICAYPPLVNRKLGTITSEHVADFAATLQAKGWQPSSVNSSLRVLRRVLKLAVEWGVAESAPKVKLLRGERHREHVVSREEESRYLAAANELLGDIVGVLTDTGCALKRTQGSVGSRSAGTADSTAPCRSRMETRRQRDACYPSARVSGPYLRNAGRTHRSHQRDGGMAVRDEERAHRAVYAQETALQCTG